MRYRTGGTWLVAAAAGLWLAMAGPASAQEDPAWESGEPAPAEEDDAWGDEGGAEGGGDVSGPADTPEGMWVGGGLHTGAGRGPFGFGGLRAEFGLPLIEAGPGLLELALPLYTAHRGGFNQLFIVPELQYEIEIPVDIPQKLSVVPYTGFGVTLGFVDQGPLAGTRTSVALTIPLGAWARFQFQNGAFVQVMPLGTSFNIGVSNRGFGMLYHFFAMGGYRWD